MTDDQAFMLAGFVRLTDHGFALPIYQGAGGGNATYVALSTIAGDRAAAIAGFEQFDDRGVEMLEVPLRRVRMAGDPWLDVFLWKDRILVGERHELIGELDESLVEIAEVAPLTVFDLAFDLGLDDTKLVADVGRWLRSRFTPEVVRQSLAEAVLGQVARLRVRRWAHREGWIDSVSENDLALVRHYPFDLSLALAAPLRDRLEAKGHLFPLIGEIKALAAAADLDFFEGVAEPDAIVPAPTPTRDRRLSRRQSNFATLADALDYAALGARGLNFTDARGNFANAYRFSELRRDARAHAARLRATGINFGDRVGLIADTSPDFAAFFFGCVYLGAVPVPLPLPTSFGGRENYINQLATQLRISDAKLILCSSDILEMVSASADIASIVAHDWTEFASRPGPAGDLPNIFPETICFLQFTSGSKGIPQVVNITHQNLLSNIAGQAEALNLSEADRYVSWLPWYHGSGLIGCLLAAVANQVSVDFLQTQDFARRPLAWLDMITRVDGRAICFSPSFGYDICARRISSQTHVAERFDLSRWKVAGSSSDMIRSDVMRRFVYAFAEAGFDPAAFVPTYGLAEATSTVSMMPIGEGIVTETMEKSGALAPSDIDPNFGRSREIVNCGKAIRNMSIEIRSRLGEVLGERHIGRIWCSGPSVTQGYINKGDGEYGVAESGWLDTGDVGYLSDGYLYVVGRDRDAIIVNGRRYWAQDIEWELEKIPGLMSGDIAAFTVSTENGDAVPTLLVHCRISDEDSRLKLRAEIAERVLRTIGLNVQVELVAPRSLPRDSTGNLSREKARSQYLGGEIQPFELPTSDAA